MKHTKGNKYHFRVDSPQLLNEIASAGLPRSAGVLKVPLNVFRTYLIQVAQRAIELNDPKLNILMLEMNLYEIPPNKIIKAIENQKSLLKELK